MAPDTHRMPADGVATSKKLAAWTKHSVDEDDQRQALRELAKQGGLTCLMAQHHVGLPPHYLRNDIVGVPA